MKSFSFLLLVLSLQLALCEVFDLKFKNTKNLGGIFIRKLASTKLYVGNGEQDQVLDISDTSDIKLLKEISSPSTIVQGTVCPYVQVENTDPTYVVSKQSGKVSISNIKTGQTKAFDRNNDEPQCYGIFQISDDYIILMDRSVYCFIGCYAYRYFAKIKLSEGKVEKEVKNDAYYIGGTLLSSKKILGFYAKDSLFYSFLNPSDLSVQGSGKLDTIDIYSDNPGSPIQVLEFGDTTVVACLFSKDKITIECFTARQNNNQLSILKGKTTLLSDYIISTFQGFSLIKSGDSNFYLGCGTSKFVVTKRSKNFEELIKNFVVTGDQVEYVDFTILDGVDTMFFGIVQFKKDVTPKDYFYQGSVFHFPSCKTNKKKYMLMSSEKLNLKRFYDDSMLPSETKYIFFPKADANIKIIKKATNERVDKSELYKPEDIFYFSQDSISETITFQGANYIINPSPSSSYFSGECTFEILVCHLSCKTCSSVKTDYSHNCNTCNNDGGYYWLEGHPGSCYTRDQLDGFGKKEHYYLDANDPKGQTFKECHQNCATCNKGGTDSQNNCKTCDKEKGFYSLYGDESNCKKEQSGYVLVNDKLEKCARSCDKCRSRQIGGVHNCVTCKEGFTAHPSIASNCVEKCESDLYYIGDNYDLFCVKKGESCPFNYPILVEQNQQCVSSCNDQFTCKFCIENGYIYEYNHKCVRECPNGVEYSNKCKQVLSDKNNTVETSSSITYNSNNDISPEEFKRLLEQTKNIIFDESNPQNKEKITNVIGTNYTFSLVPTGTKDEDIFLNNASKIDLGECEEKLREKYQILKEKKLYIGQINYNASATSKKGTKPMQYEVYDEKGEKLDLSVCSGTKVSLAKRIVYEENLNLSLAEELKKESGFNIYDPEDPLFNDYCIHFSLDGKDLPLSSRRESVFVPASFCDEGCVFQGIEFDKKEAQCECEPQKEGFESILEENELFSTFSSLLSDSNLKLFTCMKVMKQTSANSGGFMKNVGSWIMIAIIVSIIPLTCIFFLVNLKKILSSLNRHLSCPPNPHPHLSDNKLTINSDDKFLKKWEGSHPSTCSLTKIDLKGSSSEEEKFNHKTEGVPNQESEKKSDQIEIEEEIDDEELNEMEFDEAVKVDTRTFFQYYLSILLEKQIVLSTIFNKSVFYPLSLRLIMFLFTLASFFFLNALLYTDDYISKRYSTGSSLNFLYILKDEISKSIYVSIIALYIQKFMMMATSTGKAFKDLLEEKGESDYEETFHSLIKEMKRKYAIVIVIIVLFSFVYWYFLYIFCDIYRNNQISWIQSTFISIGINCLIPVVLCFIVAIIRKIGLKLKSGIIFSISYCLCQLF